MSPGINNRGGGVDSGGAEHAIVARLRKHASYFREDEANGDAEVCEDAADHIEAQSSLLTKSLCTLQALVSNMEESGWQPIETVPDCEDGVLICDATKPQPAVGVACYIEGRWRGYDHGMGVECFWPTPTHWMHLPEPGQSVLGTFDLEALKTLVGEIDDVLGGSR